MKRTVIEFIVFFVVAGVVVLMAAQTPSADPVATRETVANGEGSGRQSDSEPVPSTATSAGYVFQTISFPGAGFTLASGIVSAPTDSSTATVVGCYGDAALIKIHGFRHGPFPTNFETIDYPGGTDQTCAMGIAADETIVGYHLVSKTHYEGFIDSGVGFTTLAFPGAINTYATAITYDFRDKLRKPIIVGYYCDNASVCHGFLYHAATGQFLGIGGASTHLYGVADSLTSIGAQNIVGYTQQLGKYNSFLFDTRFNHFAPIAVPGATATKAMGIDPLGLDVVGGFLGSGPEHGLSVSCKASIPPSLSPSIIQVHQRPI